MKYFLLTILILFSTACPASAQDFYGTNDLKAFREGRDKEFRDKTVSPLKPEDLAAFTGLNYFPADKNLALPAKFEKTPDEKFFMMPTSKGTSRKYIKLGVLKFNLGGVEYALNAYQSEAIIQSESSPYKNLLFVPFKDLTNGRETYGGGRYLNIKKPEKDEVVLDFNLAYNPNCAYGSEEFACPIPPKENFLQAEIKAGEKTFEYSGKKHIELK
ncbi:MAG TPA: DUF1684 domain-containing protein [Pyrinomonadaceae bacterium]|jgi:uncharacterized protein (DUF1684 family)